MTNEKKKKASQKELTLVPIDLLVADKFLNDENFAIDYVRNFVDPAGKKEYSIQFPWGIKPIKIKTIFEVDNGLRFALNGKSSGGKKVLISLCSPLLLDSTKEQYIKRLESFCEKKKNNTQLAYSEKYDKFSSTENIELYDILIEKLRNGIFSKRPSNPLETLEKLRDKFISLSAEEQAKVLLQFIASFGRTSGAGINLTPVDKTAPKSAGITDLSSNLSNWKKSFQSVRIIYSDASGLHETKSINLLDLI